MNGLTKALKAIGAFASKHAPELLTAVGIVGSGAAIIFAVKATPKAEELISEKKKEKNDILTPLETAKTVWKCYIPAAGMFLCSAGCIIAANAVHEKRSAALTAAYALSETALAEYSKKVVETVGEKKEELIRAAAVQKKIDSTPIPTKENKKTGEKEVVIIGDGNTLCYDTFSGGYFYSDKNKIEKAINELNRRLLEDDFVSLNDFYDLIGREQTDIGNLIGWNVNIRDYIDVRFTSHLNPEGKPCLAISFTVAPKYEYDSL